MQTFRVFQLTLLLRCYYNDLLNLKFQLFALEWSRISSLFSETTQTLSKFRTTRLIEQIVRIDRKAQRTLSWRNSGYILTVAGYNPACSSMIYRLTISKIPANYFRASTNRRLNENRLSFEAWKAKKTLAYRGILKANTAREEREQEREQKLVFRQVCVVCDIYQVKIYQTAISIRLNQQGQFQNVI